MKEYRVIFEKKGIAKYISHLDLNRCMLRAVRRSGLPAWYTEGFHPHLYLMFPLPLSLGVESTCEIMDFRLMEEFPPEVIRQRLNDTLPEGLRILLVEFPSAKEIVGAEYQILFSATAISLWNDFLNQPAILAEKHTKKGMKEIDIKPMITVQSVQQIQQNLLVSVMLPAGNQKNLNCTVLTDAFLKYADKPILVNSVCRTKIFFEN